MVCSTFSAASSFQKSGSMSGEPSGGGPEICSPDFGVGSVHMGEVGAASMERGFNAESELVARKDKNVQKLSDTVRKSGSGKKKN